MLDMAFELHNATLADAEEIAILEAASFPADEAASPEAIRTRIVEAGDFFWTFRRTNAPDVLVGFVNGTCITTNKIHHESMSQHESGGRTLVIHSVTISANERRKGLGSAMLKKYIQKMTANTSVDKMLLLSKSDMLTFYVDCGFKLIRLSDVAHGQVKQIDSCTPSILALTFIQLGFHRTSGLKWVLTWPTCAAWSKSKWTPSPRFHSAATPRP